jgi:hypothetical protein
MHAGKRETYVIVTKTGGHRGPASGRVALFARRREVQRRMARIRGALEIAKVATYACRGADIVVSEFWVVAIGALPRWHGMHSRKRESGAAVVKG